MENTLDDPLSDAALGRCNCGWKKTAITAGHAMVIDGDCGLNRIDCFDTLGHYGRTGSQPIGSKSWLRIDTKKLDAAGLVTNRVYYCAASGRDPPPPNGAIR